MGGIEYENPDTGDYVAGWLMQSLAHTSASAQDIAALSEHFERIIVNERRRERTRVSGVLWNLNMNDAVRAVGEMDDGQATRPYRSDAGQVDTWHDPEDSDCA